jgi:hypothetical protein
MRTKVSPAPFQSSNGSQSRTVTPNATAPTYPSRPHPLWAVRNWERFFHRRGVLFKYDGHPFKYDGHPLDGPRAAQPSSTGLVAEATTERSAESATTRCWSPTRLFISASRVSGGFRPSERCGLSRLYQSSQPVSAAVRSPLVR